MKPGRVIIGLPQWGLNGVCAYAANLVRGLSERGWDARLLLTEENSPLVNLPGSPVGPPADLRIDTLNVNPGDDWSDAWIQMIRYLEEQAPCVYVPNHDWRGSVVSARLSDRVAVVGILHNDAELEYDHAERLGRYWNAVVAVNPVIHEKAAERLRAIEDRLVTIPIGVALPESPVERSGSEPLRLIYHGALRRHQKRLPDLLAISDELDRRGVAHRLTIVGDGEMRAELEASAEGKIAAGAVRMTGMLDHERTLALLESHDLFVLTSEYEGMPNALLEAMARGLVPVVSDIATLAAVVDDGINGLMAPVGETAAFADHIAALAGDSESLRRLSAAATRIVKEGGYSLSAMAGAYDSLFERVLVDARDGGFKRVPGSLRAPPESVAGTTLLEGYHEGAARRVNRFPLWPGSTAGVRPGASALKRSRPSAALKDHRIIIGATSGRISGVDIFSVNLARELRNLDYRVEILMTQSDERVPDPLPMPDDVTVKELGVTRSTGWPQRWRAMKDYLESNAPSIYLPNYDLKHSCAASLLAPEARVVGIVHSDDPQHYEHVSRLGEFWDAVVAVSRLIAEETEAMNPSLAPRIHTVPYGVEVPDAMPRRETSAGRPLKIVYTGRLSRYQKRVLDIVCVAEVLEARGVDFEITVVGNGPDQPNFLARGARLIARRRIRYIGGVPNSIVQDILRESDVFLLTSSFEGLPVSLLEAMAQGCVPVVSAIRSGVPELLRDGENGYVVPVGDIGAFADRLQGLASDPALLESLAGAAYQRMAAGGFSKADMAAAYIDVFEQVLASDFVRPTGRVRPPPGVGKLSIALSSTPMPIRTVSWKLRKLLRRL